MADYSPTYADETKTETLTEELKSDTDTTHYDATLLIAYEDSDIEIETELSDKNVPIPSTVPAVLEQVGTLLAAAFMYNDFYTNEETASPTAKVYRDQALSRLGKYIDTYLSQNQEDNESLYVGAATYISNS